jgi:DDE domain
MPTTYLYRAVDSRGQTIDFLISAKRDAAAAKRFFRKAQGWPHTVNPRTNAVEKSVGYPKVANSKSSAIAFDYGDLIRFSGRPRFNAADARASARSSCQPQLQRQYELVAYGSEIGALHVGDPSRKDASQGRLNEDALRPRIHVCTDLPTFDPGP